MWLKKTVSCTVSKVELDTVPLRDHLAVRCQWFWRADLTVCSYVVFLVFMLHSLMFPPPLPPTPRKKVILFTRRFGGSGLEAMHTHKK